MDAQRETGALLIAASIIAAIRLLNGKTASRERGPTESRGRDRRIDHRFNLRVRSLGFCESLGDLGCSEFVWITAFGQYLSQPRDAEEFL